MNHLFIKYILTIGLLVIGLTLSAQQYETAQEVIEEAAQEIYEPEEDYYEDAVESYTPTQEENPIKDETYKYDRSYFNDDLASADFDKTEWETTIQELNYSEDPLKPKKKTETTTVDSSPAFNGEIFSKDAAKVFRTFFFIIAIGLLVFILYRILRSTVLLKNPNIESKPATVSEVIENIQETELDRFLREALASNNYKLAIRVCYLMVIKELSLKQYIEWKKDKTNGEYLKEMRDHKDYKVFRDLTRFFERSWFGDMEIQQQDYTKIKPQFDDLINAVATSSIKK